MLAGTPVDVFAYLVVPVRVLFLGLVRGWHSEDGEPFQMGRDSIGLQRPASGCASHNYEFWLSFVLINLLSL